MRESLLETIIGAAVLVVAGVFVWFAVVNGGEASSSTAGNVELGARFNSASGIERGTDVRMAGVKVGTVTGIDLNAQTFRADTTVMIHDGIEIPDDSAIVISSEGLLGGNYVEIMPGGSPFYYEPGSEIEDTQGSVSLISLLLKFVSGGGSEGE